MQVLVTRPQPEAARTAARLSAFGHEVLVAPLLMTAAVDWAPPPVLPEAVAFTSAAAVRLAGPQLASLRHLPVFAVGEATAAAAREAGFGVLVEGASVRTSTGASAIATGTAAALFAQISATGFTHVLYLAGRDRTVRNLPPGVEPRVVYAATPAAALPEAALSALASNAPPLTLLYSARTAACFAELAAGLDRTTLRVAALSPQVLAGAGPGWASAVAAPQPTETALFTAAGLLPGAPVLQRPS